MVDEETQKMTLAQIDELSVELYQKMKDIGYVSKEFWEHHDRLVPLLIFGASKAKKQGNEEMAEKFEELREDVKNNTPSGYWK